MILTRGIFIHQWECQAIIAKTLFISQWWESKILMVFMSWISGMFGLVTTGSTVQQLTIEVQELKF